MSKKILFFGNERLATGVTTTAPTFRALHDAGYEITSLVIAQNDQFASRNKREPEIIEAARQRNVPVITARKLRDLEQPLKELGAEAAVLVAFGKIIPDAIINAFPKGILNIHPSLLPRHRGPTPIESVILQGDQQTGTSIMQLAAEMDAGPVFDQQQIQVPKDISKQDLADTLLNLGKDMLLELLPGILNGAVSATPQQGEHATYDKLITKEDAQLQWQKTADQLVKEVRAFKNWPRTKTIINGQDVIITLAHVQNVSNFSAAGPAQIQPGSLLTSREYPLAMQTSSDVFVIDTLIPAGKNEMTARAFVAGHPVQ